MSSSLIFLLFEDFMGDQIVEWKKRISSSFSSSATPSLAQSSSKIIGTFPHPLESGVVSVDDANSNVSTLGSTYIFAPRISASPVDEHNHQHSSDFFFHSVNEAEKILMLPKNELLERFGSSMLSRSLRYASNRTMDSTSSRYFLPLTSLRTFVFHLLCHF